VRPLYPPDLEALHQIYLDRSRRAVAAADAYRLTRPHRSRRGLGPWLRSLPRLVPRGRPIAAPPPVAEPPTPRLRSV
jgi:hypothetical protein